jgi:uncharacterized damage-inducible protein DinB
MEKTQSQQNGVAGKQVITPEELLQHWQGHRRVTRRVIEAFPEEQLFNYSIGGMRPFADMVREMMGLADAGLRGVVTGNWTSVEALDYHSGKSTVSTKEEILKLWDNLTAEINTFWPQIPLQQFSEVVLAFNAYEGEVWGVILYWIDNEIHHRAQAYVYLRSLGIEPPAFWNRD